MRVTTDALRPLAFAVGLVVVGVVSLVAVGAQDGDVIEACYNRSGSVYRIGVPDQPDECRGRDTEFSWNAEGEKGDTGDKGNTGDPGADGLSCWDLDGDGVQDPGEDANDDGNFDTLDCRGPEGPPGAGNAVVRSLAGTSAGCPDRGWCPGRQSFHILDPAVSTSSVILVNVLHPPENVVPCRFGGFALDGFSLEVVGLKVFCDIATPETAILNYVVFNP